jgi:branched-chain amino acid transport system ATP-binding protein
MSADSSQTLLETAGVGISFGGLRAVDQLCVKVDKGEIVGLIGPNGAGKTTAFNMITGVYKPTDGAITLAGRRIEGRPTHEITRLGIARTFQNIRLFRGLSVLDNVRAALHAEVRYKLLGAIFRPPSYRRNERELVDRSMQLLSVFSLDKRVRDPAGSLPYGDQRKLEIVRALATKPKLLLLDEPAAGMNPQETANLMELIHRIRREFDVTVLLIEHDMSLVMKICERIYVLEYGRTIAHGTPGEIKTNQRVIKAYLGEE